MKRCFSCLLFVFAIVSGQFVTHHNPVFMPNIPRPAVGSTIVDPRFGTQIIRITNAVADGRPGTFPQYSKRQAWNCDESRLFLMDDNGYVLIYDGQTYEFIREVDRVYGEDIFWHPTDPDVMIFADGTVLASYNIVTDEYIAHRDFSEYAWINTRGEGNLSRDGRYYAFVGQDYDTMVYFRDIVVYDIWLDSVVARMPLPETISSFDWVSISPLGNYVVVDYATTEIGRYEGVEVYDRNMNFIWQKPLGAGHSDLGIDATGAEVLVMDCYDPDSNVTHVKKFRLSDGAETILLTYHWSFDGHISCRNFDRNEWCFISTFDGEGRLTDDSLSWLPFEDEIFALKLDGSRNVQRIAHHHSRRFSPSTPDRDNSVYWAEPHATVSRDGGRMLFGSNWRMAINLVESIDAYVVDFRSMIGILQDEKQGHYEIVRLDAYPNPFNSSCEISVSSIEARHLVPLRIEIYDLRGNIVFEQGIATPYSQNASRTFIWTPQKEIPSGVYLVRVRTKYGQVASKRTILMR